MKNWILLLVLFWGNTLQAEEIDLYDTLSDLNERWTDRDLGTFGQPALEIARGLAAEYPSNYDAQWQHSRAAFWQCFVNESNTSRQKYCKEGWKAGEKAVALNSSGVEGYYFSSLNIGIYANAVGIMEAVSQGLAGEIEGNARKAANIDASYDGGGPHRILGRYYQNLPWPLEDLDKAKHHFDSAYSLAPGKALNLIYLAEYYIEVDNPAKAKEMLETILDSDYRSSDAASYRKCVPRARELLEGL